MKTNKQLNDLEIKRRLLKAKSELPAFIKITPLILDRFPNLSKNVVANIVSLNTANEDVTLFIEKTIENFKNL